MKDKKKKEKVIYIDDGRTIADMSNVGYGKYISKDGKRRSTFKEKWNTYWEAVKMMLVPMLVVIGIITVAYLVMYFSLK